MLRIQDVLKKVLHINGQILSSDVAANNVGGK